MAKETTNASLPSRVAEHIEQLRSLVQSDGGEIALGGVDEETGVVSIRFQGACRGCPGAAMTLKMGVERNLREKVPEVTKVVAV